MTLSSRLEQQPTDREPWGEEEGKERFPCLYIVKVGSKLVSGHQRYLSIL